MRFRSLTPEAGLPQSRITVFLQDTHHFMWMGSENGLIRYDGYSYDIFTHDPHDPTTIGGNHISSLAEDSKGRIWIGTKGLIKASDDALYASKSAGRNQATLAGSD